MKHISGDIYGLLMRQGTSAGTAGTVGRAKNKGPALSTMASSGEVKAVTAGGQLPPIGRQEKRPMGNSGKSAEAKAPANNQPWRTTGDPSPAQGRPVLQLVHSSRDMPTKRRTSVGISLVLVWSR